MKAVLDIGKTHIKLLFVSDSEQVASFSCKNAPIAGQYPQADVDSIWDWIVETLKSCTYTKEVEGFVVTTHGATAALIDSNATDRSKALALPILDYEYQGIDECTQRYKVERPDFNETLSPLLPAGLNLGKQLYWLQEKYPQEFAKANAILLYPQYWAWRLGAELSAEVTSLGCHTDLWHPAAQQFSSFTVKKKWAALFPPLKNAWDCIGQISEDVSKQTSLPTLCKIYCGIHDSNASFLRYLNINPQSSEQFTVMSTGTWTILMQSGGDVSTLHDKVDTLANVDINGNPVSCARFMGGREYERICTTLGGNIKMNPTESEIQDAISNYWRVTPDFSEGNGPFPDLTPQLLCPERPTAPQAIATLYCALMINQRLDDLQATGAIYIEGAFLKNPLLCRLVAQLRCQQPVFASTDNTGTVLGAAALIGYQKLKQHSLDLEKVEPSNFSGLDSYADEWVELIKNAQK
ncbi:FGGY-family carbohydrate kinase [Alteromonas sp. BMJM2]|uniref:FGGY-family carbohydrate kinase n=1 Tax=Alteromonas sp. BMJM2 TaxID=2954241 RepID=UPI0022B4E9E5|nr:FGGY family carbohydrate kinase [Alteromonas sp. BMJM2]